MARRRLIAAEKPRIQKKMPMRMTYSYTLMSYLLLYLSRQRRLKCTTRTVTLIKECSERNVKTTRTARCSGAATAAAPVSPRCPATHTAAAPRFDSSEAAHTRPAETLHSVPEAQTAHPEAAVLSVVLLCSAAARVHTQRLERHTWPLTCGGGSCASSSTGCTGAGRRRGRRRAR